MKLSVISEQKYNQLDQFTKEYQLLLIIIMNLLPTSQSLMSDSNSKLTAPQGAIFIYIYSNLSTLLLKTSGSKCLHIAPHTEIPSKCI